MELSSTLKDGECSTFTKTDFIRPVEVKSIKKSLFYKAEKSEIKGENQYYKGDPNYYEK